MYLDSLINDYFLAYVGGPCFVNPILYSLTNDVLSVCISVASMYLTKEQVSHSAFLFTPVLQSNVNRIYTFSRIGDAKFPKHTGG